VRSVNDNRAVLRVIVQIPSFNSFQPYSPNTFGYSGGYKETGWAMVVHYPESRHTFAAVINTNYSPEEVWALRHMSMPVVLNFATPELTDTQTRNVEKYKGTSRTFNRCGDAKPDVRIVSAKEGSLFWNIPDTQNPGAQLFQANDSIFT
jgi:hypothetical protein